MHWPLLGSAISLAAVVGICIYGLFHSSGLENAFNTFICAGLTALDGMIYGGGNFDGVNGI